MTRLTLLLALSFSCLTGAFAAAASAPLAGHWRYDASLSTELSPWKSFDLTLGVDGDRVSVHRRLGWARRDYEDRMELDLRQPVNVVPAPWWPDNRHLGAYAGGDKTKRVRAEWLDDRRILRLSTDQLLSTQQGDRAVNTLTDFKVSANGTRLTVTELRSTRNRPIVYIFHRVLPVAAQP